MKIGPAFSDNIHSEKRYFTKKSRFSFDKGASMRNLFLQVIIILFSITLFGRLVFLQVIQGGYYRSLSDTNRLQTALVHAPRGIIFDRTGKSLVLNMPGFREVVNGKIQLLTQEDALAKIAKGNKHLEVDSLRYYPYKDSLAHIIGYLGQISPEGYKEKKAQGYQQNDLVGVLGIEAQYESFLRGNDGKILTEVDALGQPKRTLGQSDPISGRNITLTIDADFQQKVFDATKDIKKGVVIVSTPQGEILSMVSRPSFDTNLFTMGKTYHPESNLYSSISQIILDNQNQPFLNRAITGLYAPGSTFKLVVAAAGLESGLIDQNYTVDDEGTLKLGDFSFSNWYYTENGKVEGIVNIIKAIQRSNDIFFYKVGNLLGVDKLSAFAQKFGLGSRLGIDLPGEAKGLVPTKEWKKKIIGDNWYTGDDYHYGIGQGYLLTTPLQVNTWTQTIANKGTMYQPHLLKSAGQTSNTVLPKIVSQGLLKDKNFNLIRQGMIAACEPGGVAYPLFHFKVNNAKLQIDGKNFLEDSLATRSANATSSASREVSIACKTGTAENGDTQTTTPHAWITLFAPAYNPQIVITVLVENGGGGSDIAAPIAKKVLEAWFEK
ncbi:MAG TPA: penicillin-binding transpeptidase domain-containing protein [Candidatus Saccharimonadales bacterium]|nr:penicillin-binding transpeptidase domain-containing protein [Candidatus Saccharimonadales bacterium]